MPEQEIAEAMRLMSSMSQNDILGGLMAASKAPAPPISAKALSNLVSELTSLEARLQRLEMRDAIITDTTNPALQYYEKIYTDPKSGREFGKEILHETAFKFDRKWSKEFEAILKAAKKCGVPTSHHMKDGNIENAFKSALMRQAAKTAFVNGVWQSALLTSLFDIKLLVDGKFNEYLIKVGIGGLYGGAVGGLSSWINHPFFGNGVVLGVLVGSVFGTTSLVCTGDWARFGKTLGISITGGAAAWGGAAAGGTIGAFVGGIAAGFLGRYVAPSIPGLGGMTEYEVKTMAEAIKQQLTRAEIQPDPSLSPEEVVAGISDRLPFRVHMTESMAAALTELHDTLRNLQDNSPEVFSKFLSSLRGASS